MAQSDRTTALNRMHMAVKELIGQLELISGHPPEGLQDLKSAVDDVRLRLWAVLMEATSSGERDFGERFRLRRAAEILQGILGDAAAGRLQLSSKEAAELGVVARELGRKVTGAQ